VRVVLRWGHAEGGERLEETDSRPLASDRDGGRDDGRWGMEDELVHGYRSL
jgi:hypothetical protein